MTVYAPDMILSEAIEKIETAIGSIDLPAQEGFEPEMTGTLPTANIVVYSGKFDPEGDPVPAPSCFVSVVNEMTGERSRGGYDDSCTLQIVFDIFLQVNTDFKWLAIIGHEILRALSDWDRTSGKLFALNQKEKLAQWQTLTEVAFMHGVGVAHVTARMPSPAEVAAANVEIP